MMQLVVEKLKPGFVLTWIVASLLPATVLAEGSGNVNRLLGLPPASMAEPGFKEGEYVNLGRKLFLDQNLSADRTISCRSCHRPDLAFSDGKPVAVGVRGREGARNAPSLINAGYGRSFFWEGRRETLEAQVLDPLFNPNEHGLRDADDLLERIRSDASYSSAVRSAFDKPVARLNLQDIGLALATFVRTLNAGNTPVDRYLFSGDKEALSSAQRRGLDLFRGRAQCSTCHVIGERDALFTDHGYHSHSIGFAGIVEKLPKLTEKLARANSEERGQLVIADPDIAALGRFVVTLDPQDIGRFKTPSLRNVALTAPYMHDGSLETLEAAVMHEVYYRGRQTGHPLILTPSEKHDLIEFLQALISPDLPR